MPALTESEALLAVDSMRASTSEVSDATMAADSLRRRPTR